MFSSVHARGYTLLIVITLFFAAVTRHHHTEYVQVRRTVTEQKVACVRHDPCPPVRVEIHKVYLH